MYVMLSRATRLEDLLLMRAPDVSFFLKGPPKNLKKRIEMFTCRTNHCRAAAEQFAWDLGLAKFFHG